MPPKCSRSVAVPSTRMLVLSACTSSHSGTEMAAVSEAASGSSPLERSWISSGALRYVPLPSTCSPGVLSSIAMAWRAGVAVPPEAASGAVPTSRALPTVAMRTCGDDAPEAAMAAASAVPSRVATCASAVICMGSSTTCTSPLRTFRRSKLGSRGELAALAAWAAPNCQLARPSASRLRFSSMPSTSSSVTASGWPVPRHCCHSVR